MQHVPFRAIFFVSALLALGVYAVAVTIPNVFSPGDPIIAADVNENFQSLASAVEERALPLEIVSAGSSHTVPSNPFVMYTRTIETMIGGRWLIHANASVRGSCDPSSAPKFWVTIDGAPVPSTGVGSFPDSAYDGRYEGAITGMTDVAIVPGTYAVGIALDCSPNAWTSANWSPGNGMTVVVYPESSAAVVSAAAETSTFGPQTANVE